MILFFRVSDFYPSFTSFDLVTEDTGFHCINQYDDPSKLLYSKVTCYFHGDPKDTYQETVHIIDLTYIQYIPDFQENNLIQVEVDSYGYYCALIRFTEILDGELDRNDLEDRDAVNTLLLKTIPTGSEDFKQFRKMMISVMIFRTLLPPLLLGSFTSSTQV